MTAPIDRSRPLARLRLAASRLLLLAAPAVLGLVVTGLVLAAPPSPEFSFSPPSPQTGEPVTFTYGGSDPEGDPLTVSWDFEDDGTLDAIGPAETHSTVTHAYPTPGPYTVRMLVSDGTSEPVEATQQVTVNAPPTADFSISPPVPLLGEEVTLSSTSTDDQPIPSGNYAWELDGDDDFADAAGATVTHRFTTPGPQEIKLRVTDSDGALSVATKPVTVNRRPLANFDFEPRTPRIGESIQLTSRSTDPDGDETIVSQEWDLDGDGLFDDATGSPVTHSFGEPGEKAVRLRVTDGGGARSVVRERKVRVYLANPEASFGFAPASPLPGQTVTFTSASVASPGASVKEQLWDFESDGTYDAEGGVASVAYPSAGPRTVTLQVTDDNGVDVVTGQVVVNAPPDAALRFSPAGPLVGDTVELTSLSVDPDGPIASEAWDLDGDGAFDDAAGRTASRSFPTARAHTVRLRVTDTGGVSDVESVAIDVRARPSPAPTRFKLLSPRPVVRIAGDRPARRSTRIRLLTVRARSGSLVAARCRGKSCPARALRRKRSKGRVIRLRWLERRLRVRTRIAISVTYPNRIGSYTSFRIRARRRPQRRNLCLIPGTERPKRCPL